MILRPDLANTVSCAEVNAFSQFAALKLGTEFLTCLLHGCSDSVYVLAFRVSDVLRFLHEVVRPTNPRALAY